MGRGNSRRVVFSCIIADNLIKYSIITVLAERCNILGGSFKASEKDTKANQYYPSMLDVIKGIMGAVLKDNEFLKFAVITGCLRIAKESIFTAINK